MCKFLSQIGTEGQIYRWENYVQIHHACRPINYPKRIIQKAGLVYILSGGKENPIITLDQGHVSDTGGRVPCAVVGNVCSL